MLIFSKMTSRIRRPPGTTVIVLSAFLILLVVALVVLSVKFNVIPLANGVEIENLTNRGDKLPWKSVNAKNLLLVHNDSIAEAVNPSDIIQKNFIYPIKLVPQTEHQFDENDSANAKNLLFVLNDSIAEAVNPSNIIQKDFVYPIKLVPKTESKFDENENQTYHHSGNFRRRKAQVWDSYPEYKFEAFGKPFHLVLEEDSDLMISDLMVTEMSGNSLVQRKANVNSKSCYYSGILKNEPNSHVTVSLCDGMKGSINSVSGSYFIEPAEPFDDDSADIILHTLSRSNSQYSDSSNNDDILCEMQENIEHSMPRIQSENYNETHVRKKRASVLAVENTIELMIAVDSKMKEYHGEDLENYIFTLLSMVARIFKDPSIGNHMRIALVKLVVLSDPDFTRSWRFGSDKLLSNVLNNFCRWQHLYNDLNHASRNYPDCAIFITREFTCDTLQQNICDKNIGVANLSSMCNNSRSCAVVRDNGLSSAFTIAHELGHTLGIPHDREEHCANYKDNDNRLRVMFKTLIRNENFWTWSACSRHYLTEFLDLGRGRCLHNNPIKDELEEFRSNELPGEIYSLNRQCELIYGEGYEICSYNDACRSLWCSYRLDKGNGCKSNGMPWAEGTPCGNDSEHWWCYQGQCVKRDMNVFKPVNGNWGPWQPFTTCSRTCGGGIRKSKRFCNNPSPSNGGKYCVGERIKYQSCNIEECPPGTPDFRTQQCAKYNGNNKEIYNLTKNVQWKALFVEKEPCALFCQPVSTDKSYRLESLVIDGTDCSRNSYDICVDGLCLKAGCDHILDSNTVVDSCGVCGGNNTTCKRVHKSIELNTVAYGYNFVTILPTGASHIFIRSQSRGQIKSENYLALKDTNDYYLLNGDKNSINVYFKHITYEGVDFNHSGSNVAVERINISRALKKDLILEVLSVQSLKYPPTVDIEYTIPISPENYYRWGVTEEWTMCNRVCKGQQRKILECVRNDSGERVSEESCADLMKPQSDMRNCNQDCSLKWNIVGQSECSAHCGPGIRTINYRCFREFDYDAFRTEVPDNACHHILKPPENQTCIGTCNYYRWKYYEWQPCSVTCGNGIQTREAVCVDQAGKIASVSNCLIVEKITEKRCVMEKCPLWSTGEWGTCSVTCGIGERSRSVRCVQGNLIVSLSLCSSKDRPKNIEICELEPCPEWKAGPWSLCSVTCGTGMSTRSVRCTASDENLCSSMAKPSEVETCSLAACSYGRNSDYGYPNYEEYFVWKTDDWERCSVTCGYGVRRRTVFCYNERTNKVVDSRKCNLRKIPSSQEPCNVLSCAEWKTTEWSSCSVTCGKGISVRNVWCEINGAQVSNANCLTNKPANTAVCDTSKSCDFAPIVITPTMTSSTLSSWRMGRWGECSSSCGRGHRIRHVVCQDDQTNESNECDPLTKPGSTQECNLQPCPENYHWEYGKWSECNKTCGLGYQFRRAGCVTIHGQNVSDIYCNRENSVLQQTCQNNCPPVYLWLTSEWSECSVSCGHGFQRRFAYCQKYVELANEREIVSDDFCDDSGRPIVKQECTLKSCFFWLADSWGECNVTCGSGKQKRKVSCLDANGKKVKKIHCNKLKKPGRRRKCFGNQCDPTTCLEIKRRFKTSVDRDYVLSVLGRNITIYCHQMRSNNPIEYLTLPAGERDNFSEFFGKRLIDPATCPENSRGKYDCPCVDELSVKTGKTTFSKIRLSISTLQVDTKDFTFAKVGNGSSIPFGEAGDCYSSVNCPQGVFSINLKGTGLRISPLSRWKADGASAFKKIEFMHDNRKVVGRCGGYCATCHPDGVLKLDVLPP